VNGNQSLARSSANPASFVSSAQRQIQAAAQKANSYQSSALLPQKLVPHRRRSNPAGRAKNSLAACVECDTSTARSDMKVLDIPRSGKRGNMVWQRNRYGQYCYPAFIPSNPRTPAQVAVRGAFGAVSARWRTLTEEQRVIWCAVAKHRKSKPRLGQCGPLTGFLYFVKINVALANRGLAQIDLPPEHSQASERAVLSLNYTGKFDQPPVGPTLWLRAKVTGKLKEESGMLKSVLRE
jgi:hypothetical protein